MFPEGVPQASQKRRIKSHYVLQTIQLVLSMARGPEILQLKDKNMLKLICKSNKMEV